jgi:hypothetical protein
VPWPTKPHVVIFRNLELFLLPSEDEILPAIFVSKGVEDEDYCRATIMRFLSIWSWIESCGIGVEHWTSGSHPFRAKGHASAALANFPLKFDFWPNNLSRQAEIAVALFREARSIGHTAYSVLSYLKIFNLLEKGLNGQKRLIERYLPEVAEPRARERLNELGQNPDGRTLPDYILEACRHAVAHAHLSKEYVFDPDDPQTLKRIEQDEPIIAELASLLIRREFGIPSRDDNWKSNTHYIAGMIWWIGGTTYRKIMTDGSVSRRSLRLPKTVDILAYGNPSKLSLRNLSLRVESVVDKVAALSLSSADGLLHLFCEVDFSTGRLIFDPLEYHLNLDDGSVAAAERAADLQELFGELFRNGVCQLWDSANSTLLAQADPYVPYNFFFDREGHQRSMEEIHAVIEFRRNAST